MLIACSSNDVAGTADSAVDRSDADSGEAQRDAEIGALDATGPSAASAGAALDSGLDRPSASNISWSMPACAEAYGVVAREPMEQEPYRPLSPHAVEGAGERAVLSWSRGWALLEEQTLSTLPAPIDGRPAGPVAVALTDASVAGVAYDPNVERAEVGALPFETTLVEIRDTGSSRTSLTLMPHAAGPLSLYPNPFLGETHIAYEADGALGVWGHFVLGATALDASYPFAEARLDADRTAFGPLTAFESVALARGSQLIVERWVPHAAHSAMPGDPRAALMRYLDQAPMELVVRIGDGQPKTTLVQADPQLDWTAPISVTVARDGDLIRVGWLAATQHAPTAELSADIDLATDELRVAVSIASQGLQGQDAVRYLARPSGGIDVIKLGSSVPDFALRPGQLGDVPLAIYLAVGRPIDYAALEPLRVGAGGRAWELAVGRMGDKLVLLWSERAPRPEAPEGEPDVMQGLYWAVLDCAPPPARAARP